MHPDYFFAPADGIILYQQTAKPEEDLIDVKGVSYSLRDALRDPDYGWPSLVVGIFMTFFDVHVNRIPFPGRLTYRELDPIDTVNHPMLDVERDLLEQMRIDLRDARYLRCNQRMVNRIHAARLGQSYYVLQIADYDVDSITPFQLKQNRPYRQGDRFSQIRYGSQVDLIIPLREGRYSFHPMQSTGTHVEAGIDPLVRVHDNGADRGKNGSCGEATRRTP